MKRINRKDHEHTGQGHAYYFTKMVKSIYVTNCTNLIEKVGHNICQCKRVHKSIECNALRNKYSQKRNCTVSFPISTFMSLWVIYILYYHHQSAILLQENMWTDPGNIYIAHRNMNVEIWTGAAQYLFWEYINGIFGAACSKIYKYRGDTSHTF